MVVPTLKMKSKVLSSDLNEQPARYFQPPSKGHPDNGGEAPTILQNGPNTKFKPPLPSVKRDNSNNLLDRLMEIRQINDVSNLMKKVTHDAGVRKIPKDPYPKSRKERYDPKSENGVIIVVDPRKEECLETSSESSQAIKLKTSEERNAKVKVSIPTTNGGGTRQVAMGTYSDAKNDANECEEISGGKSSKVSSTRNSDVKFNRRSLNSYKISVNKDCPSRKVSFKIRGHATPHRLNPSSPVKRGKFLDSRVASKLNSVARLASQFNSLGSVGNRIEVEGKGSGPGKKPEPRPTSLYRVSNQTLDSKIKIVTKSAQPNNEPSLRNNVQKKDSLTLKRCEQIFDSKEHSRRYSDPRHTAHRIGNVKATIRIFEQNAKQVEKSDGNIPEEINSKGMFQEAPRYPKVTFKRNSKLVMVDCGNIDEPEPPISREVIRDNTNVNEPASNKAIGKPNTFVRSANHSDLSVPENEAKTTGNNATVSVNIRTIKSSKNQNLDSLSSLEPIKNLKQRTSLKSVHDIESVAGNMGELLKCCDSNNSGTNRSTAQNKIPSSKVDYGLADECKPLAQTVQPNSSFLWGKSSGNLLETRTDPDKTYQAIPVIITDPEDEETPAYCPPIKGESCDYDDVGPVTDDDKTPSLVPSGLGEDLPFIDEGVYDDVGPYNQLCYENTGDPTVGTESDASRNKSKYGYVDPSSSYDDCEGEGYQFVEGGRNGDDESNIYDDVRCPYPQTICDDVTSISNCYESIYSVGAGDDRATAQSTPVSLTGSFCDQSNSLYGATGSRFDSASVSQASTLSADDAPRGVLTYHLTSLEQRPGSDASDEWVDVEASGSEYGDPVALRMVQERCRNRRTPSWSRRVRRQRSRSCRKHPVFVTSSSVLYLGEFDLSGKQNGSISQPVQSHNSVTLRAILYIGNSRESQEMTFFIDKEGSENSSNSDTDHHYEMLYEVVGGQKTTKTTTEDDFDSFDSEASDSTYNKAVPQDGYDITNERLPNLPAGQNIYGITKIAEAAGKKMLKLRKSLSKMRTKRNSTDLGTLSVAQSPSLPPALPLTSPPTLPPALPPARSITPPSSSPPALPPARSITPPSSSPPVLPLTRSITPPSTLPPVPSAPSSHPAPMEKAVSSGSLSRRKYWSLRRFKRSLSSVSQHPSALPGAGNRKGTAMFYLSSADDMDSGPNRGGSTVYSEGSDVPSSRSSCGSTNTLVYECQLDDRAVGKRRPPLERPHSPPPLPPSQAPELPKRVPRNGRKSGNSSWYAECGLFDQTTKGHSNGEMLKRGPSKVERPNSHSWYTEIGLYGTTSFGNGSSQSIVDKENKTDQEHRFVDEPLYQFYTASVAEQAQRDISGDLDSDGYEEICDGTLKTPVTPRPTAMELIHPKEGKQRSLWCEIPEVVNSQVLGTINAHQRKLQEAKFEIITSEASYANSLNVLEKHFISSEELCDETILSKNDRRTLFSNVLPVKNCSSNFLVELEACWQENILLNGICDIIYKHATNHFSVYVKYCSHQIYLDRTLRRLKEQHGKFAEALSSLESGSVCHCLSLHSFLMLPMQRITRLPLLVDAVLTRLSPEDDEYLICKLALATLNKIVQECNEGARRMERMEEILILNRQLEFSREVKAVPIISSSRWLIKKGEVTHIVWRGDEGKLTFGKKFSKAGIYVFLFTDMLIVTKKKSDDCYLVTDYCPRNLVQITVAEDLPHLPVKFTLDGSKHLMLLTMLQNHERKTIEMVLSCPLESDRQRWLEAVNPPVSSTPGETLYTEWDCPQVTAVHPYLAGQPDELSLNVADVVNVLRKMPDGWYQGERIRDGETGWFPGNYTVEVASTHVRARNLKQRYRLLALSENYLISQVKDKNAK